VKRQPVDVHFNIAEFIEEFMEEEKTGTKKELKILEDVNMISKITSLKILKFNYEMKSLD
jgi:hypothetical protein